jgi:hypothetical protein
MALAHIELECSCGESAILTASALRQHVGDALTIVGVMDLARRLRCQKCGARGDALIYDDKRRLLYDPERVMHCVSCNELIPFARIEANPRATTCTVCAQEGALAKAASPYPQPPADMKSCPKCGAATAMYQNSKFKNWFVGCSTYPKCHWSRYR